MGLLPINSHTLGRALLFSDCLFIGTVSSFLSFAETSDVRNNGIAPLVGGLFLLTLATSFFAMGLYRNCHKIPERLFERLTIAFAMIVSVMLTLSFLAPAFRITASKTLTLTVFGCGAVLVTRLIAARIAARQGFQRRVLVIGDSIAETKLYQLPHAANTTRFTVFSRERGQGLSSPGDEAGRLTTMQRVSRSHELVIADEYEVTPESAAALLDCRLKGARVTLLSGFMERETRKVELTQREAYRLILSCSPQRTIASRLMKRCIDIVGSLALLSFTLPLLLIVGVAIKATDGGPIFFRQARVGLGGRPFMITKFRTMRIDAEARGALWATRKDSRITPVGRLLRRPRIDELPQLFDVLRGTMSLVGPRPEQVPLSERLAQSIPLYSYRHLVPPGLTGWAQINLPYADSLESTVEKTQYDLYYLKNGSIVLDLIILVQTIRIVLFSEGSR